jgi:hypothetical protein
MPEKSNRWPELPPEVVEIVKRPKEIISIECSKHYVCFFLNSGHCSAHRIPKCKIMQWLSLRRFLRVKHCVVINMHYLNGKEQGPPRWKVKLINDKVYGISQPYRDNFMKKLGYMFGIQEQRLKKKAKADKKNLISKFDV